MQTTYTTKVISRSPRGAIKGELYEGDVMIATFTKPATGWYYGVNIRFGSSTARSRFDDFCDSLTFGETLEALTAETRNNS